MSTLLIKNISQLVTCDDKDQVLHNVDILCARTDSLKIAGTAPGRRADRDHRRAAHALLPRSGEHPSPPLPDLFPQSAAGAEHGAVRLATTLYEIWKNLDSVIRLSSLTGMGELLKHGCTTCFDHHYVFPAQAGDLLGAQFAAAEALGIRMYCSRGSMDLSVKDGGLPPDSVVSIGR